LLCKDASSLQCDYNSVSKYEEKQKDQKYNSFERELRNIRKKLVDCAVMQSDRLMHGYVHLEIYAPKTLLKVTIEGQSKATL
jgi:hypothetical protein